MTALLSACCWAAEPFPEPKHLLRRGPSRRVYVVITPGRVFTFTAAGRAEKFVRRARRLPSMAGQAIESICTLTNGSIRSSR